MNWFHILIIFIAKKTDNKVKAYLKQPLPDAFLSTHELPKIILLEYLQKGKAEELIKPIEGQHVRIYDAEDNSQWPQWMHDKILDRKRRFKEIVSA